MLHSLQIRRGRWKLAIHPRNQLHELLDRTYPLHLLQCGQEVLEGELFLPQYLLLKPLRLPLVNPQLRPLHEPDNITLLEDSARQPCGIDRIQII